MSQAPFPRMVPANDHQPSPPRAAVPPKPAPRNRKSTRRAKAPEPSMSGNDGGDIPARLARVEADVSNLVIAAGDLRGDVRLATGAGVGAAVGIAAMVVVSYLMLSTSMEAGRKEMTETIRYEIGRLTPTP